MNEILLRENGALCDEIYRLEEENRELELEIENAELKAQIANSSS